ncbi:hypothetical protein HanXRQr2_Chr02g0070981 [Helianthus annuus]|uniref:DUF3593 domain-containing protein n=1 Tax=Helianthus annuus TaxID=4232 RepID=A0A251TVB7_HELAN|nr:uncharacterized protein LOC110878448 [Helianthus annuus]KAF5818864.1 hypothetical protein HanXRQr2_Chr02g0070981 [Helianthus annuus]KAJ0605086.1 hypothetical protein HanHA300_Chr02g0059001 [Helianthus annuus]KAJ0619104.1 hypothetical protein HanHA89_Chr02g0067551 [Helianthus annuus]KAJ0777552.1 hypothetical protein HanLR1_Chr02g0061741 [Helianthus annuus]KAJ0786586.1 hypothetical protein HanOQP8_Chr02g0072921 [Helianthus annuus]
MFFTNIVKPTMINSLQTHYTNPVLLSSSSYRNNVTINNPYPNKTKQFNFNSSANPKFSNTKRSNFAVNALPFPVDPWSPTIDSQSIASQLFAVSLFPYIGFLYFITRSNSAPKLTLFGFYFLLAFVGATIPAGIYAKVQYGTSLSNVDWLHGGAESLLTLTNLFIVIGLRQALRKVNGAKEVPDDNSPST